MRARARLRPAIAAGCLAALAAAAVASAAGGWSATRTLEPPSRYAAFPALAADGAGTAAAAWFSGPPQAVSEAPRARAAAGAYRGARLLVATGTVRGGLAAPVVLAAHAAQSSFGLGPDVAVAGDGEVYVGWAQIPGFRAVIAAGRGGRFGAPAALPAGAQLVALLAGSSGPVLAVWLSGDVLDYARLGDGGRIGAVVAISRRAGDDGPPALAANSAGALLAAWVRGVDGSAASRLRVVRCDAAEHCTVTPSLALFGGPERYRDVAVALADDGAATVLAGASAQPGVGVAVSRGGAPFAALAPLAPGWEVPVAAAGGGEDAVVLLSRGAPSRLAVASLARGARRFGRLAPLAGARALGPAKLAVGARGELVATWDAPGGGARLALGGGGTLGAPLALRGVGVITPAPSPAADGAGDAIAVWSAYRAGASRGVFEVVHRWLRVVRLPSRSRSGWTRVGAIGAWLQSRSPPADSRA